MATRKQNVIVVAEAEASLAGLASETPPEVYVSTALQLLGPDLRREIRRGWTDEELLRRFSSQDPDAFMELLKILRDKEKAARRDREAKAKLKKGRKALRSSAAPPSPASHSQRPPLPLLPGGNGTRQAALPPPSDPTGPTASVTRNRGIRRPD